ncbi:MAG: hypothetical protein ACSLEW_12580 [Nocardioides sp.]
MGSDAVVLQAQTITDPTRRLISRLQDQLPHWLTLHVVGYDPDNVGSHPIDGATHHQVLGPDDLGSRPRKIKPDETRPSLVPGNVDWLMLSVAAHHPDYDHIWWIEDDVRYSGSWRRLFRTLRFREADLLTTHLRARADDETWHWWPEADTPATTEYAAFMPFGRISRPGIDAVERAYAEGWRGHAESFVPTAVAHAGLILDDITDFYTADSFRFRPFHLPAQVGGKLLWHPVRSPRSQARRHRNQRISREAARESTPASPAPDKPSAMSQS